MVSFVLAQTLRVSHSKTPGMGSFPDAAVNLKLAVPDVHHSPVYIYIYMIQTLPLASLRLVRIDKSASF